MNEQPNVWRIGFWQVKPELGEISRDGRTAKLDPRLMRLLMFLAERPGQVVAVPELLDGVWGKAVVTPHSVYEAVAALRQALEDHSENAAYIVTLPRRGYRLIAPVEPRAPQTHSRTASAASLEMAAHVDTLGRVPGLDGGFTRPSPGSGQQNGADPAPSASFLFSNLPSRLIRMVGRDDDVLRISTQLTASRFVTLLGAGGIGKTTVAVAVGHDLIEALEGGVVFVDLGALSDPKLVATTLASTLGLSVQTDDATPGIIAFLRDKRLLLILDTCEHVIEATADLASRIFMAARQVHILTTTREALRVEGEHVYKLDPLGCPPDDPNLTASFAQTFPATQLFLERAVASGARIRFGDEEAGIVAAMCRKLDGVALAIELAAGRVGTYGLQRTAATLDERLTLLWPGQRTAPPRQKTLQATLDWSYGLLSPSERVVLRRLAVFVGYFTFEAALDVVTDAIVDKAVVFTALESLIAKSMVATHPVGTMMRCRLLDTTRAYALTIEVDDDKLAELAERHAGYYRRWLAQSGSEWPTLSNAAERAPHLAAVANVRAALEWCFSVDGNLEAGVGLAAAAAPVFLAMSLMSECHRWCERAILALGNATRGGFEEMRLQAGLGMSLMFTRAHSDAAREALQRSLAIAEERKDILNQMLLLGPLHMFHFRTANFGPSLDYAGRSSAVAAKLGDPSAIGLAHCLSGVSLHYMGELSNARAELEAALREAPGSQRSRTIHLGFDYVNWASIALGRTLWLQGYPAQAVERVHRTVKDAECMGHAVTLSIVLHWSTAVFLWTGDLLNAEKHLDWFISRAETYSLGPYVAVGLGLRGELAIRRGDAKNGVENLQACLARLHAARYELLTTAFNIALVQGLAALGRMAESVALIDAAIQLAESNGDLTFMPELLRVKGRLLLSIPQPDHQAAEKWFLQSLDWSRRQGARAWELRAATDLAALFAARGQRESARMLLQPAYEQFMEGSETADMRAAGSLLANLE